MFSHLTGQRHRLEFASIQCGHADYSPAELQKIASKYDERKEAGFENRIRTILSDEVIPHKIIIFFKI